MKLAVKVLCLILLSTSLPSISWAQINSLSEAINESGRLRMLSQRMAKAHLLIGMDIRPEKATQQLKDSQAKFEQNLIDLDTYADTSTQKHALTLVKQQWREYKALLDEAPSKDKVLNILNASDATLTACEALVQQFEQASKTRSAALVNISGRQRMLSQRIGKLYTSLAWSGIQPDQEAALNQAISEFEDALVKLQQSPDNTAEVSAKLNKVMSQWQFSKAGFRTLKDGQGTPFVISMTTESSLKKMNEITHLYQEIDLQKILASS